MMISVVIFLTLHFTVTTLKDTDVKSARTFLYGSGLEKAFENHKEDVVNILGHFNFPNNATILDELRALYRVIEAVHRVVKGQQLKSSDNFKNAVLSIRPHFNQFNFSDFKLRYRHKFEYSQIREYRRLFGENVNLYSVDRAIVRLLSKPLPRAGNLLLNNIRLYNSTLSKIFKLFKRKDMKVATIAEILWERNGPRFLVNRMDDLLLQKTFSWTISDLTTMYDLLNETQALWRQLRVEYSNMLTERLRKEGICGLTDTLNEEE